MAAGTLTRRGLLGLLGLGGFMTVPDFPDEKAPDAHATAISLTGAPPLVFKRVIDFQVGTNIAAGATLTRPASGQFSLNQPGYEISVNVGTLGATAPVLSVELQWYDSSTTSIVDDEIYYFFSGNLNGHFIHGRGPSKGDQVVVVVKNYSGASAVSFSYTLLQTSRTFTREFWHTIQKAGVAPVFPGFTAAVMNMSANVLVGQQVSVPASSSTNLVMPLYTGTIRLQGATNSVTAGQQQWNISDTTDQVITTNLVFNGSNGQSGFAPLGAGSLFAPLITLPRGQCTLGLINGATLAQNMSAVIAAQEDRA